MKVVCFIATLSGGGAERQLLLLASLLKSRGHEISIATFGDVPDHYSIPNGINRVHIARDRSRVRKIAAICRYFLSVKTDAVICFGQRESSLALIPLLFRRKIKAIAGERNLTTTKRSMYERLLSFGLYRRANWIVPNSYSQNRYLSNRYPYLGSKIKTIINYTDIEKLLPDFSISNGDNIKIGIFSRFVPQKNCLNFIKCLDKVKKAIGEGVQIHWYGDSRQKGQEDYVKQVFSLIDNLNLGDIFVIHPPVKNVAEVMKSFDAICLPSLSEGFSNAISEAICLGKPMLASDVSDNSLLIHHSENGYLFNPHDIDDISNKIISFCQLPLKNRQIMGHKSREIAEKLFNKENFINSYLNILSNQKVP